VPQLAFTGSQAPTDFAQGLGLPELAKQHGHELPPTGETAGMPFGAMLTNQRFKLQTRKQLEQLRENAAYSIHGGTSWVEICRSGKLQTQLIEIPPLFQKPNLDKPEVNSPLQHQINPRPYACSG
jgi:hypothetical protein